MRKLFIFILLIYSSLNIFSQIKENTKISAHPKIGLSLSGGGAKGFAHIGVLKVLDSLGVKIDYISGTSMGAIVGGLYASGYTGKDIEKIVLETDFYNLLTGQNNRSESTFFDKSTDKYLLKVPIKKGKVTLPSSITSGQKNIYLLKELFKNVSNIKDFSKLPIPFMCVATNLESGKTKVFENGDISESIMASSAFPSLMDPVKVGDSIYVDGAMTVNFPSEFLKKKGIDIVIGVDLSQGLSKRDNINSIVDILNQVIDFGIEKETENQEKYTDLYIHPELKNLSATSYDEKEKILNIGYNTTLQYVDFLKKLPKRSYESLRAPNNPIYSNIYKIDNFELDNHDIYEKSYILGKMGLKLPSLETYGSINKMIDKLYATNNFKIIKYSIIQKENQNILKLSVNEDTNRYFLKFGLHYDNVFKSSLLVNLTVKRLFFRNSSFSIDGIFGDKPRYYINYSVDNGYIPGFGLYSSGMTFDLKDSNKMINETWTWFRNEFFIQSIWKDKFAIGGGISYDYFSVNNVSTDTTTYGGYANPFLFLKGDNQDSKTFPKKGYYTEIEAKMYNAFSNSNENKAFQIKADVRGNFPITKWLTYSLNTFYGITINPVSDFYNYHLGGNFDQKVGNFVSFNGYNFGQEKNNNVIKLSNYFQFNPYKNYYLIADFSVANLFDNFDEAKFLKVNYSSVGLTAGYDSPFGQIKLNYSHSLNKNPGIFSVVLGHWF